ERPLGRQFRRTSVLVRQRSETAIVEDQDVSVVRDRDRLRGAVGSARSGPLTAHVQICPPLPTPTSRVPSGEAARRYSGGEPLRAANVARPSALNCSPSGVAAISWPKASTTSRLRMHEDGVNCTSHNV